MPRAPIALPDRLPVVAWNAREGVFIIPERLLRATRKRGPFSRLVHLLRRLRDLLKARRATSGARFAPRAQSAARLDAAALARSGWGRA